MFVVLLVYIFWQCPPWPHQFLTCALLCSTCLHWYGVRPAYWSVGHHPDEVLDHHPHPAIPRCQPGWPTVSGHLQHCDEHPGRHHHQEYPDLGYSLACLPRRTNFLKYADDTSLISDGPSHLAGMVWDESQCAQMCHHGCPVLHWCSIWPQALILWPVNPFHWRSDLPLPREPHLDPLQCCQSQAGPPS